VVHGVVAAFQRDLLGIDAKCLEGGVDRGGIAGQAAQVRVEIRQIVLEHRGRVALRIDGNEQRADAAGVGPQRVQHLRHVEQRRRANVRAMGEAEEHQERAALHVLIADRLAVLVEEMKRAADGGERRPGRRRVAGHEQDGAEDQHEAAEKCPEHRHDAKRSFWHVQEGHSVNRSTR
jgi:hypothetical protein